MSPALPRWPWPPDSPTGTDPMQTPWGDFPVRDAHVHFFSPAFFAALATQSGRTLDQTARILDWQIPHSVADLAAAWKKELDENGVAQAALIASIPGDEDSTAEAVSLHPDR